MKSLLRPLLGSVIVAVLLYFLAIIVSDRDVVLTAISRLGIGIWLSILALSLLNYGLRYWRWQIYLADLGHRLPGWHHLAIYVAGFALTTTPGKAGEAIRCLYLHRLAVPYVRSLAVLFVERLLDFCALILLGSLVAVYFSEHSMVLLLATALVMVALVIVRDTRLPGLLQQLGKRRQSPRLQSLLQRIVDLLYGAAALLQLRHLGWGLALGLVAWSAEGLAFYWILHSLDIPGSLGFAIGVYGLALVAGALSMIPGGLGSTEAVMALLLISQGADNGDAVAAVLICRIATLWFAVGLGFIALLTLTWRGTPPPAEEWAIATPGDRR